MISFAGSACHNRRSHNTSGSQTSVSLWATGTRPLPKQHREAFLALTRRLIAQAYAPLKPILAGTARGQLAAIALPILEHLLDYDEATYLYLRFCAQTPTEGGDPAQAKCHNALQQVVYMLQLQGGCLSSYL